MASRKKEFTVVTHAGKFHADELFAVATLALLFEKKGWKMRLIRTLDPEWFKKADYVLDIGRIYNAKKNRFDHHQEETAGKRPNGILYASFGLVWKKFGKEVTGNRKVTERIDKTLVAPIDSEDAGISVYENIFDGVKPVTIEGYINVETINILDLKDIEREQQYAKLDLKFRELLLLAKQVIKAYVNKAEIHIRNERIAIKIYQNAKNKKLIIMDQHIKYDFSVFKEPLLVVYPHNRRGWAVQNVKVPNTNFKGRIYLPKKWRGKVDEELVRVSGVPDALFCHNSGFLGVAGSKQGIISMAKLTIKKNEKS